MRETPSFIADSKGNTRNERMEQLKAKIGPLREEVERIALQGSAGTVNQTEIAAQVLKMKLSPEEIVALDWEVYYANAGKAYRNEDGTESFPLGGSIDWDVAIGLARKEESGS